MSSPHWDDHLRAHFEGFYPHHAPTPMERFWEVLDALQWGEVDPDESVARAQEMLNFPDATAFVARLKGLAEGLLEDARGAVAAGELEAPDDRYWSDDLFHVAYHVVGLGEESWRRYDGDPAALLRRLEEGDAVPGLGFMLFPYDWAADADEAEVDAALRLCAHVRTVGDPEGFGHNELIEHPDHGLGFVWPLPDTLDVWLIFRDAQLHTRRHARPERDITLYRRRTEGSPEYWYGSTGPVQGGHDIFLNGGTVGFSSRKRVIPPRPRQEALEHLEALAEAQRQQGFTGERPESTRILLQVGGCGLGPDAGDPFDVRSGLARMMREIGRGEVLDMRAARDVTHLTLDVVAFDSGTSVYSLKAKPTRVEGVEGPVQLADLSVDPPEPIDPQDDDGPLGLRHAPIEAASAALPYFSRLSITSHPETENWAREAVAAGLDAWEESHGVSTEASPDAFARLDAVVEALTSRREAGEFDDDGLALAAQRLGALAGDALRGEVGGAWGVGHLFSERLYFGLWLGDPDGVSFRWWPVREARNHILGQARGTFGARCQGILDRLAAGAPATPYGPDHLYTFAADAGYFDAGTTADGRQALMAAFYPHTFGLFFDEDGHLLEAALRPTLEPRAEGQPSYGPSRLALERWQAELGFSPAPIQTRRFTVRGLDVGLEPLPSHYESFLEDPDAEPDEERARMVRDIRQWVEGGNFVLYWGNDLWLDAEGHVTST